MYICPKLCIRLISALSLSSIWGHSYMELSLSVPVRGLWKAWHCSEAISYCGGPQANKARPTPQLASPGFSLSLLQPLIPCHCHRLHSSTSRQKSAALASRTTRFPHGPEDIYRLDRECNGVGWWGCCRVIVKRESIVVSRFGLSSSFTPWGKTKVMKHQWMYCTTGIQDLVIHTIPLSNPMRQWCLEIVYWRLTLWYRCKDVGFFNSGQYIIA